MGVFLEVLGRYDPMLKDDDQRRVLLLKERLQYWLSVGAVPSDRVLRFMASVSMAERHDSETNQKASQEKRH